jgi:hypothetical protein
MYVEREAITAAAAAAAAGDQRYKDAAYQLWHLLDSATEGKWEGLVNTWWNVTDGSWLPGAMCAFICPTAMAVAPAGQCR